METLTNDKRVNPWWWVLLAIVLFTFAARQASSQRIYITDGKDTLSYYAPPNLDEVMSEGNYPNTHNFQKNDFLAYPELNIEPSKSSDNWQYFVGGSFVFVGGMWDGLSETLAHHTDGYQIARIADVWFTLTGVTVIQINEPKKEWWRYGLEVFGMFVVRSLGFELVHGVIYK